MSYVSTSAEFLIILDEKPQHRAYLLPLPHFVSLSPDRLGAEFRGIIIMILLPQSTLSEGIYFIIR